MSKRILFIVPHRLNRCPGQRFRFEQYLEYLKAEGFDVTISNLLSEHDDAVFYKPKRYFAKFVILLKSIVLRTYNFFALFRYDIVFVYREAIMVGTGIFERLYSITPAKMIFDFDDSIWINDTSSGNKELSWLKNPGKTKNIVRVSDLIIVGNEYLAQYARQFNKNVVIIPTTIDLDYHKPTSAKTDKTTVCIGWTGTSTTLRHFLSLESTLIKIKQTFNNQVRFKLICNAPYKNEILNLTTTEWNVATEIDDLCDIDIGIMPLPDDQWAKGKCGFKGLQYMALSIPTVMSPVGVNAEIINDGENGFLANNEEEWFTKLSLLITSAQLRTQLGNEGYKTVLNQYSVSSQKEKYVSLYNNLLLKK